MTFDPSGEAFLYATGVKELAQIFENESEFENDSVAIAAAMLFVRRRIIKIVRDGGKDAYLTKSGAFEFLDHLHNESLRIFRSDIKDVKELARK